MEVGYDNKPVTSRMINNVVNYLPRTDLILETTKKIMEEEGRKMLILSDRRDHLKLIYAKLQEMGYDIGFYLGGILGIGTIIYALGIGFSVSLGLFLIGEFYK